jgi:hypothetical protein
VGVCVLVMDTVVVTVGVWVGDTVGVGVIPKQVTQLV